MPDELQLVAPTHPDPRTADLISMCGLAAVCVLRHKLHATRGEPVLTRINSCQGILGCVYRRNSAEGGRKGRMSKEGFWELTGLTVVDFMAAVGNVLWLGRCDGIVSGASAALWGV